MIPRCAHSPYTCKHRLACVCKHHRGRSLHVHCSLLTRIITYNRHEMQYHILLSVLDLICDHCNKFGVCRLPSGKAHRIPKQPLLLFYISSSPRHLNGMAQCSLHPRRCGVMCLRHIRIQFFCHTFHHSLVAKHRHDGSDQIPIPSQMSRNPQAAQHLFDLHFIVCFRIIRHIRVDKWSLCVILFGL